MGCWVGEFIEPPICGGEVWLPRNSYRECVKESNIRLRVPIILLRKTTFSKICTRKLGHLGKKGDTF